MQAGLGNAQRALEGHAYGAEHQRIMLDCHCRVLRHVVLLFVAQCLHVIPLTVRDHVASVLTVLEDQHQLSGGSEIGPGAAPCGRVNRYRVVDLGSRCRTARKR